MYAIVDIETTGGHASANGITEIAVFIHNGKEVIEQYDTLVNPGMPIPYYIQSLTGITDEMVATAPAFSEIAPRLANLLQDKIFVAHNVNFDYSFVKYQLNTEGFELRSKKLCTVRLGRKIFPGLPSYSLGNLCRQLQIPIQDRHRATGDAAATVKLFERMLADDHQHAIASALKAGSKEQFLPPNLPPDQVKQLPMTPGVYYFHDQKGKVVYVGKAKDIKKRVNSHFTGNKPNRQRQEFLRNIYSISCQETGTELIAHILESVEIKRLWPPYNAAQKHVELRYGFYTFEDQAGYLRLAIEKKRKYTTALYDFNLLVNGQQVLRKLIRQFDLCPKLCFLQKGHGPCTVLTGHICHGACEKRESVTEYNLRMQTAINFLHQQLPSFIITGAGRHPAEQSYILVEKGRFYGMGYLSRDETITDPAALKEHLTPYPENEYISHLLRVQADGLPKGVIRF
ncbi:GIY-YIG nuclease family protein [Chitinophaga pendula]|nr:DNA polymerase III subunit epsilon [Chitinophaga sp. MD30]UCJ10246.1 GIY-YIG nuclease family protein [Chitinophaga pendula]